MKIKEAFKKLDTYNELAELMNGDKMHVYFAEVTSGIGFGESFKSFADFRKYIRNEYFKEIADRILDSILSQDPEAHVACEVTACTDQVHIFGEVTTDADVDCEAVARRVITEIGYTQSGKGFDAENCEIKIIR